MSCPKPNPTPGNASGGMTVPPVKNDPQEWRSVPAGKVVSAFAEIGEWDGKQYEYEGDCDLLVGPDGKVYARLGITPDDLHDPEAGAAFLEIGPYGEGRDCYSLEGQFPLVVGADGGLYAVLDIQPADLPDMED